ncbi:MAG TPA: hypothetical protein DCG79_02990 [Clostridiales bacterium]|nr:hypothetical protein [Clostridiales bacterium]
MENNANTELIRDHVDSFILRFLAQSDSYGYDIHKAISTATEGVYEIKQPTLYSCLKRLEKQGLITSYDGETSNGAQRKYYAITDKGRDFLQKDITQWEFSRTLLDRLLSDKQIDLSTVERPFDPSELRPKTKRGVGVANAVQESDESSDDALLEPAGDVEDVVPDTIGADEPEKIEETTEETASEEVAADVSPESEKPQETPVFDTKHAVQIDFDTYVSEEKAQNGPDLQDFLREHMAVNDDYRASLEELFRPSATPTQIPQAQEDAQVEEQNVSAFNYGELKERAQAEGYRLHPYSKSVTTSYYSMNFIFSARLRRDALLLLYAFMFLEVLLSFFLLDRVAKLGYLFYIVTGCILLAAPFCGIILYLIKPDKRVRADFDFKTSLSGMIMLMINLIIISMLLAFFLFGADLARPATLIKPLLYPALLFIDLPIYTLIYAALYNTKRYHLK